MKSFEYFPFGHIIHSPVDSNPYPAIHVKQFPFALLHVLHVVLQSKHVVPPSNEYVNPVHFVHVLHFVVEQIVPAAHGLHVDAVLLFEYVPA